MTETRYEGYKEGFREGFREGLREKSGNEIREELKKELEEEVRQELRDELVDEVKAELREKLCQECKDGCLREYLDNFKKNFVEGFKEEYPKGLIKGRLEILSKVAADGLISIADAAKEAGMTEAEFCAATGMTPAPQSAPTTPQAPDAGSAAAEKAPDEGANTTAEGANTTDKDASCEETPCDGASLETAKNEAFVEGETLGIEEGVLRTLRLLVVDGALTIADAADIAGVTIAEFELRATSSPSQWTSEYEQALKSIAEGRGLAASSSATATLREIMAQARSGGIVQGLQRVLTTLVAAERITPHDAERYGEEFLAEYSSLHNGATS